MKTILTILFTALAAYRLSAVTATDMWFAATPEARLHAVFLDSVTGEPIPGTLARMLGTPKLLIFTPAQVRALDPALDIFGRFAITPAGPDGGISLVPPRLIDFHNDTEERPHQRAWLLASAPGARPVTGVVRPWYFKVEASRGTFYKNSYGKVHNAWLAPIGLQVGPPSAENATPEPMASLRMTLTPEVVRAGGTIHCELLATYVPMPGQKSAVLINGSAAKLEGTTTRGRVVTEKWVLPGLKTKKAGELPVKAMFHLDAPAKVLPTMNVIAPGLVVATDAEAASWRDARTKIREAGKTLANADIDAEAMEKAFSQLEEATTLRPKDEEFWKMLILSHQRLQRWEDVISSCRRAPESLRKKSFCRWAEYYALVGLKSQDRFAALLTAAQASDATDDQRATAISLANGSLRWDLSIQIAELRKAKLTPDDWEGLKAALRWLGGDRTLSGRTALLAAARVGSTRAKDTLELLSRVNLTDLKKKEDRASYHREAVDAHLILGNVAAAREALDALSREDGKPRNHAKLPHTVWRVTIAEGDFAAAVASLREWSTWDSKNEMARIWKYQIFTDIIRAQSHRTGGTDAAAWAADAFAMLGAHEFGEALALARRAVKLDPKLPGAHLALGIATVMLGDFPGAVSSLGEAAKLAPQNSIISAELSAATQLRDAAAPAAK